ncbi:YHS domain-containing (seleno)protein [Denitrobaculum tricleocarpae]|uniref:YHS domain-containing protein n=1 Tax=Denitrobaculum tricleocarpae TaxID=2591009 RepID=A0A545TFX3_9PROT|nr:YHS domain-containing (seleno)protein [Denitrobaculum tricleocarpae]TQV76098.1 YHS domain-containing protein [Denitrobaculum tricleocarpae]
MSLVFKAFRNALFSVGLALAVVPATAQLAQAETEVNIVEGYAVHGYDVVAYFTQDKPVVGDDRFTASHEGANYRFASAENRDLFTADPAKYAPKYGGYCAFGAAMGRKFDGDPNAWAIVDGELYLNLNKKVQARWKENIPGFIKGSENNWPLIRSIADASLEASTPEGVTIGAQ